MMGEVKLEFQFLRSATCHSRYCPDLQVRHLMVFRKSRIFVGRTAYARSG